MMLCTLMTTFIQLSKSGPFSLISVNNRGVVRDPMKTCNIYIYILLDTVQTECAKHAEERLQVSTFLTYWGSEFTSRTTWARGSLQQTAGGEGGRGAKQPLSSLPGFAVVLYITC
jgi:hypothetical protein